MGVISMLVQKLCVFVYMLWPLLQSTHQIMVEPNRPIRESDQADIGPPNQPPAKPPSKAPDHGTRTDSLNRDET